MLTTVRHIFGRIMHSETALHSQWDKGRKNNLLFASPSIRRPTTSGTVTLDGILYSEGNFEKIQRKIGYLPQEIDLYPNLSVQECLEYMGDLSGIPRQTSTHVVEDLVATCNQLAVMKNGKFLYSGNMKELLEQARGHIWIYKTKNEGIARELEKKYHVSSKQYVGDELQMKLISETPPKIECSSCEATLEDAYIYLTNKEL